MFQWTDEMIRFREDAAKQNGMEKSIVKIIQKHIPGNAKVCDAGCGLGYLTIELAKMGYNMTAVDVDKRVLDILRKNKEKEGLLNIQVLQEDIFHSEAEELYDVMIFCAFGQTMETLKVLKKRCRGKGILIKKNWDRHRFTAEHKELGKLPYSECCIELTKLGILFSSEVCVLETGQPFRTLEDAGLFFKIYDKETDMSEEEIKKRLVKGRTEEFPYYFPCERQMGIITLDTGDIPITI